LNVPVADSARAHELLGWSPRHARLDIIIETAWRWECRTVQAAARQSSTETGMEK
jgi:UDP-glucose 4-epimerase